MLLAARQGERLAAEAGRIAETYGVTAVPVPCDVATGGGRAGTDRRGARQFRRRRHPRQQCRHRVERDDHGGAGRKWQAYWELARHGRRAAGAGFRADDEGAAAAPILHNASICAVQPLWYEPIYNVTKAALLMFSKNLANEVIKDNIRVNTVNPGLILTPDWVNTAKKLTANSGGDWQGYLQSVADEFAPIKRFGTVEELANFFVFLCSERASYSVGATYYVDGGMLKTV